jgi:hypothetical protein
MRRGGAWLPVAVGMVCMAVGGQGRYHHAGGATPAGYDCVGLWCGRRRCYRVNAEGGKGGVRHKPYWMSTHDRLNLDTGPAK